MFQNMPFQTLYSDLKSIKHLNLQENMVRECHQLKDFNVDHITVIIDPSDIIMKEMKDNTHFKNIRDSVMVSLKAFLKYNHNVPTQIISAKKNPSLLFHTVVTHIPRNSRT